MCNFDKNKKSMSHLNIALTFILLVSTLSLNVFGSVIENAWKSTAKIVCYDKSGNALSQGSGFIVSSSGEIATNYHVIENATSIEVTFPEKQTVYMASQISKKSEQFDLAIIKITGDFNPIPLSPKDDFQIGKEIYSIGSPQGLSGTTSSGIISSRREDEGKNYLQITTPVSAGSSGGPVINTDGEVIAIVAGQSPLGQNLNFAIPVSYLKDLMEQQNQIEILDKKLITITSDITSHTTWNSNNTYLLKGIITVRDDSILRIKQGTKIKFHYEEQKAISALVVLPDSSIRAMGTQKEPIIFTSVLDEGDNLTKQDKGLWGGFI